MAALPTRTVANTAAEHVADHNALHARYNREQTAAPAIAAGAGAGTSPTVSVSGTDASGEVSVTTGTTPAAGLLATLTWVTAYSSAARVVLCATNAAAAALQPHSAGTTTTGTVSVAVAPAASTLYTFAYVVVQ